MGLLISWGNVAFFLISSMVLGLPDQVQIFSLWYLIELLELLTGLQLLEPKLLTGFDMLVYFTNLGLGEFPVRYLALFLLFSVVDGFEWFWMESLHRSFLLVLEFLKGPLLVYTLFLITFLMVLSLVLVPMLMILLCILGVIRHLICGRSLSWLLNLNLIYMAL